jgi:nucleoside-diphosphate-sugar epimerase
LKLWYDTLFEPRPDTFLEVGGAWVDVRDVGTAHLLALQMPEAAGERFIINSGGFIWQDWSAYPFCPPGCHMQLTPIGIVNVAREVVPKTGYEQIPQTGNPSLTTPWPITYNASKAEKKLGLTKYFTREEMTKATVESLAPFGLFK